MGARGVVLKDFVTQLLLKSIHAVMAGEIRGGAGQRFQSGADPRNPLTDTSNEESNKRNSG